MTTFSWLVVLCPLVGMVVIALGHSLMPGRTAGWLGTGAIALSFAFSIAAFVAMQGRGVDHRVATSTIWSYANTVGLDAKLSILVDPLSVYMTLVVSGVSTLIHFYSVGYMDSDRGYRRYFAYLNYFVFSMLLLVLAGNFLLLIVGWAFVGAASYMLISFWYRRNTATRAGIKAFVINVVGDVGLVLGTFFIFKHTGTVDFVKTFKAVPHVFAHNSTDLVAGSLLLLVGAFAKSAQVPLHTWLPDAMEGPTPVSALIHAATMVTAGVYMVARSHVIFERAPTALMVVAIIGTLTAFFAATIGIAQTDIKKVLAYSTISQLGYMFMACGVGAFSAGIFHLMTHAFFKGLLFLGAGSVIHAIGGEQDMRKMGGLKSYIPWTFLTMGIATLAIAGIPPLAGFWSKDEILWKAYQASPVYWGIGVVTAFITSFYMFRLLFMTFFGDYRGAQVDAHGSHGHDAHGHGEPHESPMVMLVPLMILAVLSLFGGFVGWHNHFEHFLAPVFGTGEPAVEAASSTTEYLLMGVSVMVAFAGWWLAYLLYYKRPELPQKIADALGGFYQAVVHKYYIDELYAALFVKPLIDGSTRILWQDVDRKIIDAAVNDSGDGARQVSDEVRHMQSGNIRSYAGWIAAGSAVVIGFMIWMWTSAR